MRTTGSLHHTHKMGLSPLRGEGVCGWEGCRFQSSVKGLFPLWKFPGGGKKVQTRAGDEGGVLPKDIWIFVTSFTHQAKLST